MISLTPRPKEDKKQAKTPDLDLKPRLSDASQPRRLEEDQQALLQQTTPQASLIDRTFAIGGSTGGEEIPGVKEGSTALNTDQFKYYSFFSRVKEAIRFRWVTGVRGFANSASQAQLYRLARLPSPTVLEIMLDRDGMVVHINVLKSSGSATLDNAAVDAFYQASPLNHPPDEMIRPDDRMVHLMFSFFGALVSQLFR